MSAHAATKATILRHVPVWLNDTTGGPNVAPLTRYPWLTSRPGPDMHTNAYVRTWGKALELSGAMSNWEARGWAPYTSPVDGVTTWRFLWRCKDCPILSSTPANVGNHPHGVPRLIRSTARQGGVEL